MDFSKVLGCILLAWLIFGFVTGDHHKRQERTRRKNEDEYPDLDFSNLRCFADKSMIFLIIFSNTFEIKRIVSYLIYFFCGVKI